MAIISRQFNFIFVKTRKTGGTSFEIELAKQLEAEAVVTPVIPAVPGHEPRNWQRGWLKKPYFNHMTAARIREFIGEADFTKMHKFCVEREPVAKCVSFFHMLKNSEMHGAKQNKSLTWEQYVEQRDFPLDIDKYTEVVRGQRKLIVDQVIAYEDMARSFTELFPKLGLQPVTMSVQAKAEYAEKKYIRVKDVLPAHRKIIYEAFEETLEITGLAARYAAQRAPAPAL